MENSKRDGESKRKKSNSGDWILFIFYTKMRLKMQKLTQVHVGVRAVDLKPVPV